MKGSYLPPIARFWSIGSALLFFAVAGQAMATGNISGTLKVTAGSKFSTDLARVTATSVAYKIARVETDASGAYSLDVDPGTYTLTVVGKGLETQVVQNLVVKDGDKITKDFTLPDAKPFCILKSPNPIPLTDDINAASFMDVPDVRVDGGMNLGEPNGDLDAFNKWGGPAKVGGRFRVKYSDQGGIHLAADLTFAQPGVNYADESSQWKGNAIEFDLQNDQFDPTRTAYDMDHNWQLIVGISNDPKWWFYGALQQTPMLNGKAAAIKDYVLIKDRPNKDGELVRVNLPWGLFLKGDKATPLTPPKDNDVGALDLVIDNNDPADDKDSAGRQYQLNWSGFNTGYTDPSVLRPIQFCPHL